jgi:DNA-binding NtrC family response regulator
MIEPLLEANGAAPASGEIDPGQLVLRCLTARIALQRRGDHVRVFDLLSPYDRSDRRSTLDRAVRAEVMLWLGWASVWQDDARYDDARALNLLDASEQAFREELNPSGRCWALLGQAQAYFTIDEHRLMLQALQEAGSLLDKLEDVSAAIWLHDLSAAAARFDGRYRVAAKHADELERLAETTADDFARARALAHRAVIGYETGRNPKEVVETAGRAEALLMKSADHPGYALSSAFDVHAGAAVRQGDWIEAERIITEGRRRIGKTGAMPDGLTLHRARMAILRGDAAAARTLLDEIGARVHRHQRLLRSALERTASECALLMESLEEASTTADRAFRHAREAGHGGYQLAALLQKARTALASGDEPAARETVRQAESYGDYFSLLPFAAERFTIHGLLWELRGRSDEARASFAQALSAYSLIGDAHATARTQLRLARLSSSDATGEGRPLAAAALDTFDALEAGADAAKARAALRLTPSPAPSPGAGTEADIGCVLARSAFSVELVAESWLQAAEALAPGRWLVVVRSGGDEDWSLVHRRGDLPGELPFPEPSMERLCRDGVDWMRLRGLPAPAFFFGMECGGDDDPACAAIEKKLMPWIPVVGLALEHALLRADRLGEVVAHDDLRLASFDLDGFVYTSPGMRRVALQILRVRSGHAPVLVTGEPGVGKSVVARTIHESGDRSDAPFVPLECSGISPAGVDTGRFASASLEEALHAAQHGTLYLNDIGELPREIQPRLLRFIETGYAHTGAAERLPLDVRVIASTRSDLKTLVREGALQEDLFYRLNVVPIRVPPLRDRREEIPLLVHHFLRDMTHARSGSASVTSRALDALIRYDWPGNVRQLRNEIECLLVFAATEPVSTIDLDDLSETIRSGPGIDTPVMDADGALDGVALNGRGLDEILANAERSVIAQILARHDGQVSATAEALGLSRQGLYKKMKRLGIHPAAVTRR